MTTSIPHSGRHPLAQTAPIRRPQLRRALTQPAHRQRQLRQLASGRLRREACPPRCSAGNSSAHCPSNASATKCTNRRKETASSQDRPRYLWKTSSKNPADPTCPNIRQSASAGGKRQATRRTVSSALACSANASVTTLRATTPQTCRSNRNQDDLSQLKVFAAVRPMPKEFRGLTLPFRGGLSAGTSSSAMAAPSPFFGRGAF